MPRGPVTQLPPFPNHVTPAFPRMKMHVATLAGTNGAVAVTQAQSSLGIAATYVSEGLYTITFPAGGTGAFGFTNVSAPEISDATSDTQGQIFSVDSDTVNYVTGTLQVAAHDTSATQVPGDVIGKFTVQIWVVEDPLVTNS